MDTAVNQAIDQANQTNNMTAVFIATLLIGFPVICFIILLIKVRRCPKCGNRRNNLPAIQTVGSRDDRTSKHLTKQVLVCGKCGHEF
jgi:predicted nucleic-acid-binding Zn-ribbon protein